MITTPASRSSSIDLASIPATISNQIGSDEMPVRRRRTFRKMDPATGRALCEVARSTAADVELAVTKAKAAQPAWAALTVVRRGDVLRQIALLMREHRDANRDARRTGNG
jgi:acyl-CoA reductase-like NAD-dependent aldehyde dehydrogenase